VPSPWTQSTPPYARLMPFSLEKYFQNSQNPEDPALLQKLPLFYFNYVLALQFYKK
jgi:hypothetical protein